MNRATPATTAWFRFAGPGSVDHLGIAHPDGTFADAGPRDIAAWLATGRATADEVERLAERAHPLTARPASLATPVAAPGKILCFGKNFAAHAAEFGAEVPREPIFFTKLIDTLIPDGADIVLPRDVTSRIDHEIELAVVLGFEGPARKYVEPGDALELVAGYSIFNDVTARTMQHDDREANRPWLRSKSFDTFGPFGPWVVPRDSFDLANAKIELHVGDELRQASELALMVVDVPHAISYLSRHTSLRPGDLIAMGTPAGVGPLRAGDRVTGWIEGIGELSNSVIRE